MHKQSNQNDEIDLRELGSVLWRGKWLILIITGLFSVMSVYYALSLSDEYESTILLSPATSSGASALSKIANQYGGLASLAGINVGGNSGGENKVAIALELIKTWGFLEEFIEKNNLQVPLFAAKGWDKVNRKLLINPEIYDESSQQWLRAADPSKGKTSEPSSWELYKALVNRISFTQDKASGLISITIEYYSPELAKEWVERLVKDINAKIQSRDREEARKSIDYLQKKIQETQVSDMQTVFYQLIEEQTKTLMLAEVSDEYVFKTVSPARVAEEKSKPKRALICILGFFVGGLVSLAFVLIRYYVFRKEAE